jgi:phage terminase Nu1 subunit (DNA packaging protein)
MRKTTGGPTTSNLPQKALLRWSLYKAAVEFDVAQSVLVRHLTSSHQFPGDDGCYSTTQLAQALYGSLHIERLRKTREEADEVELKNAITRAEYLHRGELARGLTQLVDGILQVVNNSALTPEEKADVLNNVANFLAVLRDVAGRQTRLRSKDRNGDHKESEPQEEAGPEEEIEYQV